MKKFIERLREALFPTPPHMPYRDKDIQEAVHMYWWIRDNLINITEVRELELMPEEFDWYRHTYSGKISEVMLAMHLNALYTLFRNKCADLNYLQHG